MVMKIELIAATTMLYGAPYATSNTNFGDRFTEDYSNGDSSLDLLTEFAGRSCYQSWSMPNPETATNVGYIKNIISQGHYSVMEHASVTFYVEGVSRALTHELIRHRHLSYSQLSQRFVNESGRESAVIPPALQDVWTEMVTDSVEDYRTVAELFNDVIDDTTDAYDALVKKLISKGLTRKQAREAARAVLPNATETKIVVTGNLRAWREFIAKRNNEHADAEIQAFAKNILDFMRYLAPSCFGDL